MSRLKFFVIPVLGAAALLVLVVTLVPETVALPETVSQPLGFDHKVHVAAEVDCLQCHPGIYDPDEPRAPTFAMCMECHEEGGKHPDLTTLRALANKHDQGGFASIFFQKRHVAFSHESHVDDAEMECTECHSATQTSTKLPERRRKMVHEDCLPCHQRQAPDSKARPANLDDCMSCHR